MFSSGKGGYIDCLEVARDGRVLVSFTLALGEKRAQTFSLPASDLRILEVQLRNKQPIYICWDVFGDKIIGGRTYRWWQGSWRNKKAVRLAHLFRAK